MCLGQWRKRKQNKLNLGHCPTTTSLPFSLKKNKKIYRTQQTVYRMLGNYSSTWMTWRRVSELHFYKRWNRPNKWKNLKKTFLVGKDRRTEQIEGTFKTFWVSETASAKKQKPEEVFLRGSHYTVRAGLEPTVILLYQPPKCCGYRCVPTDLAKNYFCVMACI